MAEEYPVDRELYAGEKHYYLSHDPQHPRVFVRDFFCKDMASAAKYVREGIAIAEIAHPNVCKLLAIIPIQEGDHFRVKVAFEFLEKRLLQEIEERRGRSPVHHYTEQELRIFLYKTASALQLAHSKNITHRDIDPEHIYVTPEGEYKLVDFGVAWREADRRGFARCQTGQTIFMCPKMKIAVACGSRRVVGGYNEKKADVYNLGVTLIFMAKLFPPYTLGSIMKHEANVEKLLKEIVERDISPQFAEIIRNMVLVEESDRFDIDNVLEALSQPSPQTIQFALTSNQLHYFHFPEDRWKTVALSGNALEVNENTATAILDSSTLFCCGGGNRPCKYSHR
jgi:serine/threonine protein kinase